MNFDADNLITLLKHAGSAPRVVLEFRSTGEGADTDVSVMDVTEHVVRLEEIAEEHRQEQPPVPTRFPARLAEGVDEGFYDDLEAGDAE